MKSSGREWSVLLNDGNTQQCVSNDRNTSPFIPLVTSREKEAKDANEAEFKCHYHLCWAPLWLYQIKVMLHSKRGIFANVMFLFFSPHFLSTCRSSRSETSPNTVVRQRFVFLCVLLVSKIISRTVYFRCLSGSRLITTICSTVNSLPIPTPPPKKCESAPFVNLRHITCHSCRVESTLVRLPAKNRLPCC